MSDTHPAIRAFQDERDERVRTLRDDAAFRELSQRWLTDAAHRKYLYNFQWCGRPVIQFPEDIVAIQEIIWKTNPDWIIETGIAHGGSLMLSASVLEALGGNGRVIGIDIDIRAHNRAAIEAHRLCACISLLEGSSVDPQIVDRVRDLIAPGQSVLVLLDSNHTHDHVLAELKAYAPLVTLGSYLIVLDTIIEYLPDDFFPDRPWGPGNNPKTALDEFMQTTDRFVVDPEYADKLVLTAAPGSYLKCVGE